MTIYPSKWKVVDCWCHHFLRRSYVFLYFSFTLQIYQSIQLRNLFFVFPIHYWWIILFYLTKNQLFPKTEVCNSRGLHKTLLILNEHKHAKISTKIIDLLGIVGMFRLHTQWDVWYNPGMNHTTCLFCSQRTHDAIMTHIIATIPVRQPLRIWECRSNGTSKNKYYDITVTS